MSAVDARLHDVDAPPHTDRLVRAIGRWSLAGLMVNTMIGSAIFGLPALIAAELGGWSPFGFVIAALGVAAIAACLAEVASQFTQTGGPYLYAREAFGRFTAIQIGWLTWLSRVAGAAAGVNLFIAYLGAFTPAVESSSTMRAATMVSLIACAAVLNYRGVATGIRLSNVFTIAKLAVIFVFVAGGLAALMSTPGLWVQSDPIAITASNWLDGLLLMVVVFGGFEAAVFPSGESRDPRHDVPAALMIAIALTTLVYVGMQYVVIHTLVNASTTTKPVADSALRFLGARGAPLIAGGALLSVVGYLFANMLHTPRVIFAMGEQGDAPRVMAAVHPRFRTPSVAIVIYAIVLTTFSVAGSYRWNVTVTGFSRVLIYACIAAALPVLRRQRPEAQAFRLPAGLLFSAVAIAFAAALTTRIDFGGLAVAAGTFALAALNWLWARRSSGA
ncbi:MAG TPA: APC family permease [Vicinamibacterales bacterium]